MGCRNATLPDGRTQMSVAVQDGRIAATRRGMTRVPELLAAGLTVAFGQDCVMDPWYGLGSGDSRNWHELAHMALHVGQMTSQVAMRQCFKAVTTQPAQPLGLEGYGLATAAR